MLGPVRETSCLDFVYVQHWDFLKVYPIIKLYLKPTPVTTDSVFMHVIHHCM